MIVKIDKNEIETIKETCALGNCKVEFFTMESNPIIVQAEILEHNGNEISPADAWYIGRTAAWATTSQDIKKL